MQSQIIHSPWFGKAFGAVCAWMWAPEDKLWLAVALIAGIGLGHIYDIYAPRINPGSPRVKRRQVKLANYFSRFGRETTDAEGPEPARSPHLRFLFTALGHIAKSSGNVTPAHIRYTEKLMSQMNLQAEARTLAKDWFRQGKSDRGSLPQLAQQCMQNKGRRGASRKAILRALCELTALRANDRSLESLKKTGSYLGFAPSVIATEFGNTHRPHTQQEKPTETFDPALCEAYRRLDLQRDATPQQAKMAYRRMVSRFHPDRLSQDATPAETELAQQRMVELREALETIQAASAEQ